MSVISRVIKMLFRERSKLAHIQLKLKPFLNITDAIVFIKSLKLKCYPPFLIQNDFPLLIQQFQLNLSVCQLSRTKFFDADH